MLKLRSPARFATARSVTNAALSLIGGETLGYASIMSGLVIPHFVMLGGRPVRIDRKIVVFSGVPV